MDYATIVKRLNTVYDLGEARAVAQMMLDEGFGLSRADVFAGKVTELSREKEEELEKILMRLEKLEPIQYVLGEAWFCDRKMSVAPGVLIPRPETEELVEWAKGDVAPGKRLLDIGTGSGCIAVTMALDTPCGVTAWDISAEALEIARRNAAKFGADVAFECVDVMGEWPHNAAYDIIISNPPYICDSEKKQMEDIVLVNEPHVALFVPDDDPLKFYRRIADIGRQMLTDGGALFFECNRAYAHDVAEMMRTMGYKDVEMRKDMYGNDRMVRGCI